MQLERSYFRRVKVLEPCDLRELVPILDVLISQFDLLSKPVDPYWDRKDTEFIRITGHV